MSILHKQLALAELHPGMALSDNLLDAQGQVLLPKGAVLTQQSIESMKRHDVVSVPIVIGELTAEEEAAQRAHAQFRLNRLFRNLDDSGANGTLRQYVSGFRLGEEE